MITYSDLFCGCGGIRLAFQKIGTCVFSCDIDKFARETYKANYGEVPSGDITKIKSFPASDIICAGFPCQSFSAIGKRKGITDPRGLLWREVLRAAKQVRPTVIFLENVVGFKKYLPLLQNDFNELGYYFNWSEINSNILWVQSRPRIYMIASLGKQYEFRSIRSCPVDCRLILETEAKFRYPSETAWTWLQKRKAAGHTGKWGYQEVNRYCPTLTTKNDRIFVNQRYLTLNELKQIQ